MSELRWVQAEVVNAIHARQINEHGGVHGIRDASLLHSALDAPRNSFHYGVSSLTELAAKYVHALASNHPFADGNKRTAYICMRLFLQLNGYDITATGAEKVHLMTAIAAGEMEHAAIAEWLDAHVMEVA
jgi:death on curing protein